MKSMLACKLTKWENLAYPLLASPKLDGIRAHVIDGVLLSRNMKPIPNHYLQKHLGKTLLNGLDGELIAGDATDGAAFRNTTSAVMREDGEPDVMFCVFDDFTNPEDPFSKRLLRAKTRTFGTWGTLLVNHREIKNQHELELYEEECLEAGYEGIMIRALSGPYKMGRSTEREGYLMKVKRFEDAEARIVGFEERQHNGNAKDASGKRTTHKAGKTGLGTLGAINVIGVNEAYKGVEFSIGTGFDDAERARIWASRDKLGGLIVKFRYFPSGSKVAPRFPTWLGFRDKRDL